LFSYEIIYTRTETKSYQHANTGQDIFITDCYIKTPSANVAVQQRPMRRQILNE